MSVGLNNAQVEGVSYDSIGLPNNWYFQYKSLADEKKPGSLRRRASLQEGKIRILQEKPSILRPIIHPRKYALPVSESTESPAQTASTSSQPMLSSNELYIPKVNHFLVVNKMFRISNSQIALVEEWQYANRHFVKGGKWPPKIKFCTTSSSSNQPPTRTDCAPLVEHNSSNPNDLDQLYQIGNYITTWCSYAKTAIEDLGAQNELILANLKLLHDEQQEERAEKEARMQKKERRRKSKAAQSSKFSIDMSTPSFWDLEETEASTSETPFKPMKIESIPE